MTQNLISGVEAPGVHAAGEVAPRVTVISSDGHAALPLSDYRPYLESRYHGAFDDLLKATDTMLTVDFFDVLDPRLAARYRSTMYDSGAIAGRHDARVRLDVLAKEGIVGELIFPDGAPFGAGGLGSARKQYPPELELAGARAYNRWIVEFCSGHIGLGAQIIACLYDVSAAVEDVYWAAEHGCKSIFMPGMDADRPLYWDPIYEPLWSACADTGVPINFHGGTGMPNYRGEESDVPYFVRSRVGGLEFPFWAHRPLWFLIWSGVLERHPALRVAFTEQHSDWVVEVIAKMDHSYRFGMFDDQIKQIVPRLPSEYFERQVWIGSSLLARGELLNREQIGIHKLMFGADFPHPEGTIGMTLDYLRATVGASGMSESEIRSFLGETAAAFYGFDIDRLNEQAATVGPELADIIAPLQIDEATALRFRGVDVLRPSISVVRM